MKSSSTAFVALGLVLLTLTPTVAAQTWQQVVGGASTTAAGFGDTDNRMVMSSVVSGGYLYAGTFNHMYGAEVWRTSDGTTWARVNSDGFGGTLPADNSGAYSMAVFLGDVYAGTWATGWPNFPSTDTKIWRYDGGTTWTQVNSDGFGDSSNAEPWAMVVYGSMLYVGAANYPDGAEVWRAHNGVSWVQVNDDGFLDGDNIEISSMAEFDGYLYAATRNEIDGLQVWRTTIGTDWNQVNAVTGFGGANHFAAYAMAEFNGYLYLSTFNMSGGTVFRTDNGTTWSEIAQATGGFGDANNFGSYAMTVYNGALYLGTFNWSTGTEVWTTTNGTTWTQVNSNGFDKSKNYAVLTWSELDGFLYAGLRNDDGCEVWRTPALVFADGFESGNTSNWSLTVD
jgi:flagellin